MSVSTRSIDWSVRQINRAESAMLAGLALKWRWRDRMRAAGKPVDHPNMVMGANVQVCWEKFARYWDVEARLVPMEGERYNLTGDVVADYCDENTIGVVTVLGSTFDGSYEPVSDICARLDQLERETEPSIALPFARQPRKDQAFRAA